MESLTDHLEGLICSGDLGFIINYKKSVAQTIEFLGWTINEPVKLLGEK